MKIKIEPFAAGGIIFMSLILLCLMIFFAGDYNLKKGFCFYTLFKSSDGMLINTPVMISGVKYGKIVDIKIVQVENMPFIKIKIWLESGDVIFRNAKISINTSGLMGEKYIEIDPGTKNAGHFKENEIVRGIDPIKPQEIVAKIHSLLINTDKMISTFSQLFLEEEIKNKIFLTLDNLKKSSASISALLESNEQSFSNSIKNIEETSKMIKISSIEINKLVTKSTQKISNSINNLSVSADNFSKSVDEASKNIPNIVRNVNQSAENINYITTDTKKDIRKILDNMNELSTNLKTLSEDIKDKKNNIGSLIYSNEISKNLSEASKNINTTIKYIKYHPWVLLKEKKNALTKNDYKSIEKE